MEIFNDTSLWLAFSFLFFVGFIVKFGKSAIVGTIDKRISDIKEELQTAENLRIEAQEMLAQYQRKHRDAVEEADAIMANAQKRADEIRATAQEELEVLINRREEQLQNRLSRMEQAAIAEIQAYAADLAIRATKEIISDQLDKASNDKLVDVSVVSLSDTLK